MNLPPPRYQITRGDDRSGHVYTVSNQGKVIGKYPGVTTFLNIISKPALVPWAKKEALSMVRAALEKRLDGSDSKGIILDKAWIDGVLEEAKKRPDAIKKQAADLGTVCHQWIDAFIMSEMGQSDSAPPIPSEAKIPIQSFIDWVRQSGFTFIAGDTLVANTESRYGGALDALATDKNGDVVLLDWKTSSGIWPEYALQVAAYSSALTNTYGIEPRAAYVVRFDKTKQVPAEHKRVMDIEESLFAFHAALELHTRMKQPQYA